MRLSFSRLLDMPEITEHPIHCPYCDEAITILVDDSLPEQLYIEDCQVCCRPIVMDIAISGDQEVTVNVRSEDE